MGFSRLDVESLSAALSEPEWVLERRLEAWGWFEKMDLPGEKDEPWRYTNLARMKFKLDDFTPSGPPVEARRSEIDEELVQAGVIFTDLSTAITQYPDLVRPHLFEQFAGGAHIFSALHAALFSGGTFLYVPRGRTVTLPVQARYFIEQSGSAIFPHSLVVVEEDAEVCYLERFASRGVTSGCLSNAGIEVVAGQASRVFIASLQTYEEPVWHFQIQRSSTARDVNLKSLVVTLGGKFSRTETSTSLGGEGNSVEMLGLYFAEAGQHFDFRTLQDHGAPHCLSDLLYKGALRGDARTVYSGNIHVRPEGQETDAYQTNRNLILSDDAKADSKPELEIENNDVRCSHAASVGQIDENEVFYLQSRGIDRTTAERLIVKGFFEDVLGRVGRADVHDLVEEMVELKIS